MPAGSGVGYRLVAGAGDSDVRQAELNFQNQVGIYTLGASQASGQTAFRGSVNGGVAFLGGNTFLSRRITDSFAVVKVPDYSGVGVYADNQLVARTDANGNAIVAKSAPVPKEHGAHRSRLIYRSMRRSMRCSSTPCRISVVACC